MSFLQWNVNGFYDKLGDIQFLIKQYDLDVIALQETNLKNNNQTPKIKNYTIYNTNFFNPRRASGGVLRAIKNNLPSTKIEIDTIYQVVCASVKLDFIYLQETTINPLEIQHILSQIPKPFILAGDFNAYNQIWGSTYN